MSLKHAVLGFLSVSPMTGYDLRKHMDASVQHFWPADQAQIYRTLNSLAADGLVEVETVPQESRPDRREHAITAAGLTELDRWLAEPATYTPTRESFLVRLFFVGRLGLDATRAVLEQRAADARDLRALLEQIRLASLPAGSPSLEVRLRLATLDNGIAHARAELSWAEDLLTSLDPT